MSYRINRTDGELLVDLTDGIIDTTTTNLTLIGKNYQGFGELVNENFIKLLENFASTSQPTAPMTGQLWYDKQDQRLKIFNGTVFRSASGTIIQSSQPTNLTTGDLWDDNEKNQLYIYDGAELTLVGPNYTTTQGKTTFEAATQVDATNIQRQILKLFIGGTLIGVYSPSTFFIPTNFAIAGLSVDSTDTETPKRQRLFKGFNIADQASESGLSGFWWRGTANNAKYLIDDAGTKKSATDFLPSTATATTTGNIIIKNSEGVAVAVGDDTYAALRVIGTNSYLDNFISNSDFILRTRVGNNYINTINIDSSAYKIDFFKDVNYSSIQPMLELNSDLNVKGNLTVGGDNTYINATTLRVEDKTIELAITGTGTQGNDTAADGGGIVLKSSDGSKDFTWVNSTDSWTCNQHLDLKVTSGNPNPVYKINGTTVLGLTALGSGVSSAPGLTSVGTLTTLTVDNVKIDAATIERVNGTGLNITAGGDITIDSQKIVSVADPTAAQDVATKNYVDSQINSKAIVLSFDVTGYVADVNTPGATAAVNSIRTLLQTTVPVASVATGTVAKIVGVSNQFANATLNISVTTDNSGVLQKSFTTVSTGNVVQDIVANNSTTTASLSVTTHRFLYTYTSDGSTWGYTSVQTL